MAKWKWIIGGLGFVLGGYIGALIGYIIGATIDSQNVLTSGSDSSYSGTENTSRSYRSNRPTEGDIQVSIMVLIACVMKADGHVKKVELELVKQYIRRNFPPEQQQSALNLLKGLLERDIDVSQVTQQIRENVSYSTRLQIMHFLVDLAYADGDFLLSEEEQLVRIYAGLGISESDYQSLLSLYKRTDPDWAYKALEIERSASEDEIKKAYRRMAMKYHPDKVSGSGEAIKEKATEQFRAIQKAYEAIKQERGMK